ncbi:MAG: hypothetical protein IKE29_11130 [Paenibacillus sp.]|uniref:hypothetical protein n=1 Tax=Paenibacillus sp. TaxID=58172 RepID=UPI0025EF7F20|nr:hypothetical protein [Paenibacillus sp.]MBR2565161.1 hypothetical protein [Paenibacillus sp.]
MKKITDERLILLNLKNIRIAFIIQTIGVLGILGYDLVTKGLDGMKENPLWLVFITTAAISAYLSMSISADHENNKINPQKRFSISLVILILISTIIVFFVSRTDGSNIIDGAMIGGILFICGLIPTVYIYNLRTKRQDEDHEE